MRKFFIAAIAVLALQGTASAKVESLEGANLGEHWYGPKRTAEDLKGHIVIWENWGYN